MSDKRAKLIRKQLRAVVIELLSETVTKELGDAIYARVSAESRNDLQQMAIHMDKIMAEVVDRTKSTQDLITRAVNANLAAHANPIEAPVPESSPDITMKE